MNFNLSVLLLLIYMFGREKYDQPFQSLSSDFCVIEILSDLLSFTFIHIEFPLSDELNWR